jgi:hypothetical protein
MPPKRKRDADGTSNDATTPLRDSLKSIMANHTCAITHELMVDPVIAEDGHLYDREAITKWMATRSTSPKTNQQMGESLVASLSAKQTIADLLATNGVVDDDAAAAWHVNKGIFLAKIKSFDDALVHLRRAVALGSQTAPLLIEGAEMRAKFAALLVRANAVDVDISAFMSIGADEDGAAGASAGNAAAMKAAGKTAAEAKAAGRPGSEIFPLCNMFDVSGTHTETIVDEEGCEAVLNNGSFFAMRSRDSDNVGPWMIYGHSHTSHDIIVSDIARPLRW